MYKLIELTIAGQTQKIIKRLTDNAFIPVEPTSIDYQEYLEWLAEGNTPLTDDE